MAAFLQPIPASHRFDSIRVGSIRERRDFAQVARTRLQVATAQAIRTADNAAAASNTTEQFMTSQNDFEQFMNQSTTPRMRESLIPELCADAKQREKVKWTENVLSAESSQTSGPFFRKSSSPRFCSSSIPTPSMSEFSSLK